MDLKNGDENDVSIDVRNSLTNSSRYAVALADKFSVPAIVVKSGPQAKQRFVEFFTANIRNRNTRQAYHRATTKFLKWCSDRRIDLHEVEPVVVATYVETLCQTYAAPSAKQHLAAIRMLFDWLVIGQVIPMNPASAVRGPKHVVKKGKTPVLSSQEARHLLDSIDTSKPIGLRDRALIAVMLFSFARIGSVVQMNFDSYYQNGKRNYFRFLEKGGRHLEIPAHRKAVDYMDALLSTIAEFSSGNSPIFRTATSNGFGLTNNRLSRQDALRMIKRRAIAAGFSKNICCHTMRATGITAYLENGGTIEHAQIIAGHESPRTTKLYDRTGDEVTLDEIERILI